MIDLLPAEWASQSDHTIFFEALEAVSMPASKNNWVYQ
jgi:hypothetical protein